MKLPDLVRRCDEVLALGRATLASEHSVSQFRYVDAESFAGFRSATLSFFANVFGASHPYYTDFEKHVTNARPSETKQGIGILEAAKHELEGGWLRTTRGLVSAEIFADFLEMADHLLDEHYKDPAAVVAGSSLEEHLRQLAAGADVPTVFPRDGVPVPKKADTLNAELAGTSVYSKLDQKSVTAWLDLRNKAAHGKYGEYDEAQVKLMIEGIRQFIARVPA